ncbi:MAG: hypothetical protein ACYC5Q_10035 [Thermoleophilia bacterium]
MSAHHESTASPARGLLVLTGVLLLTIGTLTLWLGGCGGDQAVVTQTTAASAQVAAVDISEGDSENPAEFISLCANCHDRLDRELDWRRERRLIFNHPAHFARGIRCAACHQEFPHKPGRIVHVSVETCFTCHGTQHGAQGTLAPTGCDVCHTADIVPITPDHKQDTWVKLSGEGLGLHSVDAKEKRLYCKMCHEPDFCESCHRMEIPHPADWVPAGHPSVAATEREACAMCHEQQKFCDDCHHVDYASLPDWKMQHKRFPLADGAESCFKCHQPTYCSACHVATSRQRGDLGG